MILDFKRDKDSKVEQVDLHEELKSLRRLIVTPTIVKVSADPTTRNFSSVSAAWDWAKNEVSINAPLTIQVPLCDVMHMNLFLLDR